MRAPPPYRLRCIPLFNPVRLSNVDAVAVAVQPQADVQTLNPQPSTPFSYNAAASLGVTHTASATADDDEISDDVSVLGHVFPAKT